MAQTHEDFSRGQTVTASSNKAFGWVFVVVFLVIALWPVFSGGGPRLWSLIVSGLLVVITLAVPTLLTIPNNLWQRFGQLLHRIVSPLVLAVMFFVVVTPIGRLMRLLGKRSLRLDRDAAAQSYWIKRDPPGPKPDSMPRQF